MQIWLFPLLVIAAPAVISSSVVYFFCRSRRLAVEDRLHAAQRELKDAYQRLELARDQLQAALEAKAVAEQEAKPLAEIKRQLAEASQENSDLREEVAQLKKDLQEAGEKEEWFSRAEERLRESFQELAAQAMESNANEFLKRASSKLDSIFNQVRGDWGLRKKEIKTLVQPLEKGLEALDQQVRVLEQKSEEIYQGFQGQFSRLGQTHEQLQMSTTHLLQVLRAPVPRGGWMSVQLRRVVEMAGMLEHVDFHNAESEEDGRPDMIVHMPNRINLPVDAKTPMYAYTEAMETDDEQLRKDKLEVHSQVVKQRIEELGKMRKRFDRGAEIVIMFFPNDASLAAAFAADPGLLEFATQKEILLTTPVTLLALLKAVAYGWQQHQVTESTRQIASQARHLYHHLSTFLSSLGDLGRRLDLAVTDFNKAIGLMESRVLPAARRLREMGAANSGLPSTSAISHRIIPSNEADME